jgi:dipicolinate synthase subunit A
VVGLFTTFESSAYNKVRDIISPISLFPYGKGKVNSLNIISYGGDRRCAYAAQLLEALPQAPRFKIILLPTPSTKDGIRVTDTNDELLPIFEKREKGDYIFGYGLPTELMKIAKSASASAVDLAKDETLLEENARLTAIGALGKILLGTPAAPDSLNIGIIGFGRIGKHLTRLLTPLGAKLRIFTTRRTMAEELCRVGVFGVHITEGEGVAGELLSDLDVLINTAPAKILTPDAAAALSGGWVIELASGKNIPDCIAYESMPSIPGRMYPKSAGRALFERILHYISLVEM